MQERSKSLNNLSSRAKRGIDRVARHFRKPTQDGNKFDSGSDGIITKEAPSPRPTPPSRIFRSQSFSCVDSRRVEASRVPVAGTGAMHGEHPHNLNKYYNKMRLIGEGSYAKVYLGYSHVIEETVALKEFTLKSDEGIPFTAIREASIMRQVVHQNVLLLHDIVFSPNSFILVFEYVPFTLHQYMRLCPRGIHPRNVALIFFQLLRSLAFCHSLKILHRDLKPQNLLLSARGELKLADFGLARTKSVPSKTYSAEVVTLWYRPPEALLGSTEYSGHVDCWSAGCIFVEMVIGQALFPGRLSTTDQLDMVFRTLGTPSEQNWPGVTLLPLAHTHLRWQYPRRELLAAVPRLDKAAPLAASLLEMNPKTRCTAQEALDHDYFSAMPPLMRNLSSHQSIFEIPGVCMAQEPPYQKLVGRYAGAGARSPKL